MSSVFCISIYIVDCTFCNFSLCPSHPPEPLSFYRISSNTWLAIDFVFLTPPLSKCWFDLNYRGKYFKSTEAFKLCTNNRIILPKLERTSMVGYQISNIENNIQASNKLQINYSLNVVDRTWKEKLFVSKNQKIISVSKNGFQI